MCKSWRLRAIAIPTDGPSYDCRVGVSRSVVAALDACCAGIGPVSSATFPADLKELTTGRAVILIVGLGIIATYTGYTIAQFRAAHPHIHNLADAGEILLGPFGRELFGLGQILFSIFIMGSHILTFTEMMNTVTEHGTCSIVFSIVGLVICLALSLPRTIKNLTYISFACTSASPT
jgi:hypothetical protein